MAFRPTSGPMWGPIWLFGLFEAMQCVWRNTTHNYKPFHTEILQYFTTCSLPIEKNRISLHPGLKKALFGREAIIQSQQNFFPRSPTTIWKKSENFSSIEAIAWVPGPKNHRGGIYAPPMKIRVKP